MITDEHGFVRIAGGHNPVKSAQDMVHFAKNVLAHAKTVHIPNSEQSVTVGLSYLSVLYFTNFTAPSRISLT